MTPDQIYAMKRVLMLPPDELATLRENMKLHDEAVRRIQSIFNPPCPNADALSAMTELHEQIAHRG